MNSFSILICSFGSSWWRDLAISRALPSAVAQGDHEIIVLHDPDPGASLGKLRNRAGDMATSDYLVFLDADDELEPGYIDAMREIETDVRIPMVRVLIGDPRHDSPPPDPFEIEPRHILDGNFIVVGAAIRRDLFLKVGGFGNQFFIEDWVLWIRAWIAGASMKLSPKSTYRQNWREGSRNQPERTAYLKVYDQIRQQYLPLAQKAGLI